MGNNVPTPLHLASIWNDNVNKGESSRPHVRSSSRGRGWGVQAEGGDQFLKGHIYKDDEVDHNDESKIDNDLTMYEVDFLNEPVADIPFNSIPLKKSSSKESCIGDDDNPIRSLFKKRFALILQHHPFPKGPKRMMMGYRFW